MQGGGGAGWREQLFILVTLPTAEDSSLIDPRSEDLACSLGTKTGDRFPLGHTLGPQEKKKTTFPTAVCPSG